MKAGVIIGLLFCVLLQGQSLPFDFENNFATADFINFDGGTATVIENPQKNTYNSSNKVAQIVRNGGAPWSGSKIRLKENLNFTLNSTISMKVFTSAPIGTIVKFKLEGQGATESDAKTTKLGEWETLSWDFTGIPSKYIEIVFMFDFGKVGNGSSSSTFLFDDIEQKYSGIQLDLPVDFENLNTNYAMFDFGGNKSSLSLDPNNNTNAVAKVIKSTGAATWAGTTVGTNGGFAKNIPLTLINSKMNVLVWSPKEGIQVRLKVEDSKDPTHTCETDVLTKTSSKWENLEFDFTKQSNGTESLSVGLSKGWTYNKASIFFDFSKEGTEDVTYYFDNLKFGGIISNIESDINFEEVKIYPNPSINNYWIVESNKDEITKMELFDMNGSKLDYKNNVGPNLMINNEKLASGLYILKLTISDKEGRFKLLK